MRKGRGDKKRRKIEIVGKIQCRERGRERGGREREREGEGEKN